MTRKETIAELENIIQSLEAIKQRAEENLEIDDKVCGEIDWDPEIADECECHAGTLLTIKAAWEEGM